MFTSKKYPDHDKSGVIDTVHSSIKLVQADNFIRQHKAKNWKRLTDTFNHDDFYMQKPAHTSKKLTVRRDFECLTKQQHSIKICP